MEIFDFGSKLAHAYRGGFSPSPGGVSSQTAIPAVCFGQISRWHVGEMPVRTIIWGSKPTIGAPFAFFPSPRFFLP
jgi:hypothetical protein